MANHNTHLAPGFTLNVLVPTPVNVVVLWGPLGPLPVGWPHSLYQVSFLQGNRLSPMWPEDPLDLTLCSRGFALPTGPPPGIKLQSFRLCTPPVYRVLMEFKPSLFSFLPFFVQSLAYSFFFFQLFSGCGGVRCFPILSAHLHPVSASRNSSWPSTASLFPR